MMLLMASTYIVFILSYFFNHVKNRIILLNADTYQIDLFYCILEYFGNPSQGDLKEKIPDGILISFAVVGEELHLIFCLVILIIILSIVIKTLLNVLS